MTISGLKQVVPPASDAHLRVSVDILRLSGFIV